ncbi:MAG: hypothetical protein NXH74_14245 [Rhodobacteraceae bacterium]|nr:hypothetical protein [Paracoccaceae bacterium]
MPAIKKSSILVIATNGFEQRKLEVPRDSLRAHGVTQRQPIWCLRM